MDSVRRGAPRWLSPVALLTYGAATFAQRALFPARPYWLVALWAVVIGGVVGWGAVGLHALWTRRKAADG